jgi:hypothetical protein
MSASTLSKIQLYSSNDPVRRARLQSIVDAYDYVADDRSDTSTLTRVLNRMMISPRLASAVVSLGIGYEDDCAALVPNDLVELHKHMKQVGRLVQNDVDSIRAAVTDNPPGDDAIDRLVDIATLGGQECRRQGYRFHGNRCDVSKDRSSGVCGLNTNFGCEMGSQVGTVNCELNQSTNHCRLSRTGKNNTRRVEEKQNLTQERDAAAAARS